VFPVGGELTSGVPDRKEGVYFGRELPADDPRVRAGLPLHGPNLFPARPAEMRPVVLAYLDAMTNVASAVLRGLASGLGLDAAWFDRQLTADPTILFRVFRYPPAAAADAPSVATGDWGVAEHTDYGLLTLLLQDDTGGLEVFAGGEWMSVPPEPDALVCNIGDMLERMTAGLYRSTPHRVRSDPHRARLSFPFFFDPGWDADVRPVPGLETARDGGRARWDDVDLHGLRGTYGEYLLAKVAKVFPALGAEVLEPS
jgi:isopenicillin N synthase-like dioxygenase